MGDESSSKRRKVAFSSAADRNAEFCLAKDAIKLHLVSSIDDFQDSNLGFCPTFLEEHFGESGKIYGYKGLKVDIWLHSSSFHAYADIKYDSIVPVPKSREKLEDVLKDVFGDGLVENRDIFSKQLSSFSSQFSDLLSKYAEHIASWQAPADSFTRNQVFRLELASSESRVWHQRLNPLVLWFVEGASCIEVDDPRWEVYVAVETTRDVHKVTGFCNVYRFFHYPDSSRLRISQVSLERSLTHLFNPALLFQILVLPPYQNKQHGYHLVNAVNDIAMRRNSFDVTMEDPSDKLQLLRDCMDVMRLLDSTPVLSQVRLAVQRIKEGKTGSEELLPPSNLACVVRRELKISKVQFKRCWEVMILVHLDPGDEKAFTELLSKRLSAELFESKESQQPKLKHVVDTENKYDSSKTFVMMKFRQRDGGDEAQDGEVDASQREEALKELVKEKKSHILSAVKKVASLCSLRGTPVHFNPRVWIEQS
ncbi:histone acetyltransferase type B catalytic subunit isoform X1 [Selaginella moellendorffii]|uniref:histone acetyltransferase type B catalytic subunit isoform X1 n=1 Tax=Selaginella moellendorffii TaxID=88036 RepID=UPI000D1CC33D|nr:histone acetyltransferase type B catalytic subunit isoform X1 [Selaginella moellendorffii]|eukprot:XP_002991678.2 histone acetyltransferase type B catalytic subunit isoform X1 [Selaginella moellendorffii]